MPGFCLLSPPPKRRRHGCRFRKRVELLNSAAATAIPGNPGSLSASPMGFLSASLAGSSDPAAAASAPNGNLVRNPVNFFAILANITRISVLQLLWLLLRLFLVLVRLFVFVRFLALVHILMSPWLLKA